jgi:hypothetical protein
MQHQRRATLPALVAAGIGSTLATAFKRGLRHLDTFQLPAYATLFATLILLPGVRVRRRLGEP